jgi:hypothetical protein
MACLFVPLAVHAFTARTEPSGSYCGSVPFIIDNKITFNGDGTTDLDFNVRVAHKDVSCKAEKITVQASKVTFTDSMSSGDCVGDALRGQGKDPSKYYLDINGDGTLTFHSDGYPGLKMKSCSSSDALQSVETTDTPCCVGRCKEQGMEKYWSLAKGIFGTKHCGESCMDPKDYDKYHFFEKNLTHSDSATPCHDFGYTKYDSTPTHGFGPIKMTLDLYDLP